MNVHLEGLQIAVDNNTKWPTNFCGSFKFVVSLTVLTTRRRQRPLPLACWPTTTCWRWTPGCCSAPSTCSVIGRWARSRCCAASSTRVTWRRWRSTSSSAVWRRPPWVGRDRDREASSWCALLVARHSVYSRHCVNLEMALAEYVGLTDQCPSAKFLQISRVVYE